MLLSTDQMNTVLLDEDLTILHYKLFKLKIMKTKNDIYRQTVLIPQSSLSDSPTKWK